MYLRRIGSLWSLVICLNTTQKRLTWWQTIQSFIQAPSTRIRVFLNPQLFLSWFKNFHAHKYPFSNRICVSARIQIHSSTQGSSRNIGNRACVLKIGKSKVKSNREKVGRRLPSWIGSIHGKELGWILLRQREKKIYIYIYIYPYLASTRFRIQSLTIKKFPLWRL